MVTGWSRCVSFGLACALGAAVVWLAARAAIDEASVPRVGLGQGLGLAMQDLPRRWQANPDPRRPVRIAFIGDSTLMSAEGMQSVERQALPGRVEQGLARQGGYGARVALHTLMIPGLGPSGFFIASEAIIAARPDRVVLALNLRDFNPGWMREFGSADSAAFMPFGQVMQALTLPFSSFGLTTDRLLFNAALVACGGAELWVEVRQTQARFFRLREIDAKRLEQWLGVKGNDDMKFALGIARLVRSRDGERNRQSRALAERTVGTLLEGLPPDHPLLQMMTAALERFRRARIPVLVYLEPLNIEHLQQLGLDTSRLPRSIRVIERTLRAAGAQVADYHALLPDAAFRDAGDHYTFEGDPNGTAWLGDRIAYSIVKTAGEHAVQ